MFQSLRSNTGFSFVHFLVIVSLVAGGYLAYQKFYKSDHLNKEIRAIQEIYRQQINSYIESGGIVFDVIIPTYIPKGYYLYDIGNPDEDEKGRSIGFAYTNGKGSDLIIKQSILTEEEKLYFQSEFQKNSDIIKLKNNVEGYESIIPIQEETLPLFGSDEGLTVRFGRHIHIFFIEDMLFIIRSEAVGVGEGEILSEKEMLRITDTFIF